MAAPASRPVHPLVVSLTDASRGAEYSTWARVLVGEEQPQLVTASASTVSIYSVGSAGRLQREESFTVAGTIVFLETLTAPPGHGSSDALLLGLGCGMLTVVQWNANGKRRNLLQADAWLDGRSVLTEQSLGATTDDQDADFCVLSNHSNTTTVAMVLGGGVALLVTQVLYHHHGAAAAYWTVNPQPYVLPLRTLSNQISPTPKADAASSVFTGFGDIVSVQFLKDYVEPVLVLLHSDPGGRIWSGRWGREAEAAAAVALHVTAVSVSVVHQRTAVLWSRAVPGDAWKLVTNPSSAENKNSLLWVVGMNSLTLVQAAGSLLQVLAVNGWAKATVPSSCFGVLGPNPVVPLALSLDGSSMAWLSPTTALVALRNGALYVLQPDKASSSSTGSGQWTLLPTGQTLGGMGEVNQLSVLPFSKESKSSKLGKLLLADGDADKDLNMGLLFAGSRLGDSLLLGYAVDQVSVAVKSKNPQEATETAGEEAESAEPRQAEDDEYDRILRLEEEALYAPAGDGVDSSAQPNVVPLSSSSDDEKEGVLSPSAVSSQSPSKRPRLVQQQFSVLRSLTPLDSLLHFGPLGKSCEGVLSQAPPFLVQPPEEEDVGKTEDAGPVVGATARVFACGYGSSGGVATLTMPGRDDRQILTEADCFNVQCIYSLPETGIVLAGSSGGGIRVLRLTQTSEEKATPLDSLELEEVDREAWCFSPARNIFASSTLLQAGELARNQFALVVSHVSEAGSTREYSIVVLSQQQGDPGLYLESQFPLDSDDDGELVSVTPFIVTATDDDENPQATFCTCWQSGRARVTTFNQLGLVESFTFEGDTDQADLDAMDVDDEEKEIQQFYKSQAIVAVDLFRAPVSLFEKRAAVSTSADVPESTSKTKAEVAETSAAAMEESPPAIEEPAQATDWSKLTVARLKEELKSRGMKVTGRKSVLVGALEESDRQRLESVANVAESKEASPARAASPVKEDVPTAASEHYGFDEEDEELYGIAAGPSSEPNVRSDENVMNDPSAPQAVYIAVARQSGELAVYSVPQGGQDPRRLWVATGCGLGASTLSELIGDTESQRRPRSHRVGVRELRFFSCGPSPSAEDSIPCTWCLAVETNTGDLDLYTAGRRASVQDDVCFQKVPLGVISRPSQEQARHHAKLARKRMIPKDEEQVFNYNNLFRFDRISGQSGLFAAVTRPFWLVSERGTPTALFHRARYAAPAGGRPRSVSGFCFGLQSIDNKETESAFMTLHERVGRVGSQRLTVFQGLSNVFSSQGALPGGGFCVEKIPLGVTVRCIHFLDDPDAASGDHPMYAMLVSREYEDDQSDLNDDGLTPEEREEQEKEKEAARIKRQVEADLGGFDLESEWVEEIARENCFKIDTTLGGAPPIKKSAYALWIVDAAENWMVVDSFELGEYEHGMTLEMMELTEFPEEPGRGDRRGGGDEPEISAHDMTSRPFLVVGTAIVDHNGEDVTTKGRVLMFDVKRRRAGTPQLTPVELSLVYEKPIFHGPVTTVSCLHSEEGNSRLVIGAGADVNIEQWVKSTSKLTQVGFFRATMQILDILLFKSFFLLSDAYDSLYFLVWRESDKSLTLLAKDYDPIAVHAAGIMSRGAAMTFLCHDDRQNLQFFQYAPGEAAARGGNRLVCRADYHLGTQTIEFASHFCRSSLLVNSATPACSLAALKQQDRTYGRSDFDQRLGVHFGTTDGGVNAVVPLSEPDYWRLTALQSILTNALESNCALNPRDWRLYRRSHRRGGCRSNDRKKGVIDGDLVFKYTELPVADQEDIASSIGSTVNTILDTLLEVQCASMMI